jgi:hypothetical protein
VISILLLIENYLYIFLPTWIRTGEFILSIFSVIYVLAQVAVGGDLYYYADEPSETLETIVVVYMTLINLPQLVPSIMIIIKEITIDDVAIARKMDAEGYELPKYLEDQLLDEKA